MYSPKLILGSILSLIPFGGGIPFLLNSLTNNKLSSKEPHWNRLIEVKFYGKSNKNIKVWIQNLSDISKAEYLMEDNVNEWKPIGENKQYTYLANLAKEYLLTQHRINIASSFRWLDKDTKEIKDLPCIKCQDEECVAKSELECFLKCCKAEKPCQYEELKKDQRAFALYLSNIYSNWTDAYLQPLQAHIYLEGEFEFKNDEEPKPKKLVGTAIYGFTNYQYKEQQNIDNTEYSKLLNDQKIDNNNKYFINYPQTFSLEENSNGKNLKKIFEESKENSNLEKSVDKQLRELGDCDNLQCLIAKNYVKSFNSLEQPFKDILNCLKSNN